MTKKYLYMYSDLMTEDGYNYYISCFGPKTRGEYKEFVSNLCEDLSHSEPASKMIHPCTVSALMIISEMSGKSIRELLEHELVIIHDHEFPIADTIEIRSQEVFDSLQIEQ